MKKTYVIDGTRIKSSHWEITIINAGLLSGLNVLKEVKNSSIFQSTMTDVIVSYF